jgi:hypothetical protein
MISRDIIGQIKSVWRSQACHKVASRHRLHVCDLLGFVLTLRAQVAPDPLVGLIEVNELVFISLFTESAHDEDVKIVESK